MKDYKLPKKKIICPVTKENQGEENFKDGFNTAVEKIRPDFNEMKQILKSKNFERFFHWWEEDKDGNPVLRFNNFRFKPQQLEDKITFFEKKNTKDKNYWK